MSRYVVDASVAVKWFSDEVLSAEAETLLNGHDLVCLDHTIVEVASALLRKARRAGAIASNITDHLEALEALTEIRAAISHVHEATALATDHGCSVYDALYVALALLEGCQLVTADEKLYIALRGVYPGTMLWLGDVGL